MAIVIDTDVVSYIFKGDTRGELYKSHLAGEFPIISFMALAELEDWILKSNWGARRKAEFALYMRSYSVKHSTADLCRIWAEVKNNGRQTGVNISTNDAWIAATALFLRCSSRHAQRFGFSISAGCANYYRSLGLFEKQKPLVLSIKTVLTHLYFSW